MKHIQYALWEMVNYDNLAEGFFDIDGQNVTITIQDGPVKVVGRNGVQAVDILLFTRNLIESLNTEFPCKENDLSIQHIEAAIEYQVSRKIDRIKRGVEGFNMT